MSAQLNTVVPGRSTVAPDQAPTDKMRVAGRSGATHYGAAAPIGVVAAIQAKHAAAVARLSPAARHAAFPGMYTRPAPAATSYAITVDCRTGERTIATILPPPKPVRPQPLINIPSLSLSSGILEASRRLVEEIFEVDRAELMTRSTKPKNGARYAVYRLIRQVYTGWSTTKMGKLVGRDHSSILVGLKRAHKRYESDPDWRAKFDEAARRLTAMRAGAAP